jgi:hypothetical protein
MKICISDSHVHEERYNTLDKWLALLLHIQEFPGSYLCLDTWYPEVCSFSQPLHENDRMGL